MRKSIVRTRHKRQEVCCFIPVEVEYEVDGTCEEDGSVECIDAFRVDPLTGDRERLPYERWPFSAEEDADIYGRLADAANAAREAWGRL